MDVVTLLKTLMGATPLVAPEYFQLPQVEADTVYRERVYCYEHHHQIRLRWNDFPFSLGGEVDKACHQVQRWAVLAFQTGPSGSSARRLGLQPR